MLIIRLVCKFIMVFLLCELWLLNTQTQATPIVSTLFRGFQVIPGSSSGMDTLNTVLTSTFPSTLFDSNVYDHFEQQEAFDFINTHDESSSIVLIGHSFGGDSVIELVEDFFKPAGRMVDLTVQVDSVGVGDDNLPGNVKRGINYYQHSTGLFEPQGETFVEGAINIDVEKLFNDTSITHFSIDDDIRMHQQIVNDIYNYLVSPITITANANGNLIPLVEPIGSVTINGDFTITDEGQSGSLNPPNIGSGDGVDETTTWIFDYTTYPGFGFFQPSIPLASALLSLELTPKHSLFTTDWFEIDALGLIGESDTDVFKNLTKNQTETITIDLLDFYSSSDILGVFRNNGGMFSATYADDAIVSFAQLTLEPVPEPSTILLISTGLLIMIGFSYKRSSKKN